MRRKVGKIPCKIPCFRFCCCKGDYEDKALFEAKQNTYTLTRNHSIDGCCALFETILREICLLAGALTPSIIFEIYSCRPYNETPLCWFYSSLIGVGGGCAGYIIGGWIAFCFNKCCCTRRCYESNNGYENIDGTNNGNAGNHDSSFSVSVLFEAISNPIDGGEALATV